MESKAQKAALARIEELKKGLKTCYSSKDVEKIIATMEEYGLQDRLDIIESVYNILMKKQYYDEAASFAKKYGL